MRATVPTPQSVTTALTEIANADRYELLDLWRQSHGRPAPKNLSVGFLRQALSYEAQIAAAKGPAARVLRDLKRLTAKAPGDGNKKSKRSGLTPGLKPGDQLVRAWNGHTYRDTVTATGFDLEGQSWTSLSALARHITGAHWSGPRFFGLTGRGSGKGARVDQTAETAQ